MVRATSRMHEIEISLREVGTAQLRFIESLCYPLYWIEESADSAHRIRNGTAFFLGVGQDLFGVTAFHVIDAWRDSVTRVGSLRLGGMGPSLPLDWDKRAIAGHAGIDLATFAIEPKEIALLGRTPFIVSQGYWPPMPPVEDGELLYCGFPGVGARSTSTEMVFGSVPTSSFATSVSERDVSTQLQRENRWPNCWARSPCLRISTLEA